MILYLIKDIQTICKTIRPNAVFECDEMRMLNVKVDTVRRYAVDGVPDVSNEFIYIEEPTYSFSNIPNFGFESQDTPLRIFFCRFEEMHNDAMVGTSEWSENSPRPTVKRLEIRNGIEEEMVRPFIWMVRNSELGMQYPTMFNSMRVTYPRSRFDANEVSVGLELNITENWCLQNYKPGAILPDDKIELENGTGYVLLERAKN